MNDADVTRSHGNGNLLDRLSRTLRQRSESAESLLHTLCHLAEVHEIQLFLVGGLVRDIILGDPANSSMPLDIDLAVDGDLTRLHAELAAGANAQPTLHDRFGTASASLPDGTQIDVARTRSERYPSPGALPIVSPASIEVDLARRDFTVNAVALPLTGNHRGEMFDPHRGLTDLRSRLIRTLHQASFRDDPTRLVRAARYAARIGGVIERRTLADARRDRHHLGALSPERFGDAWRLLLTEQHPCPALEIARRLKIPQSRDARWVVARSTLAAADDPEQFWAAVGLLYRDQDIVDWLPRSVGMQRRERLALRAGTKLRQERRRIAGMRRASRVAESLGRFPEVALLAGERLWSGTSGSAISHYLERQASVQSPISAERIMELGIDQGPAVGEWLRRVDAAIWDGELDPGDPESVARMEQRIRLSR